MRRSSIVMLASLLAFGGIASVLIGRALYLEATLSLWSLGLVHFAGYLFFLLMPVEALVPVFLAAGHTRFAVFAVTVTTAMVALAIDYAIGYLVPHRRIINLIGEKRYARAHTHIDRYGKYVILVIAASPLSSPILLAVAGVIRFDWREALGYSLIGTAAKYAILVAFF